MSKILFRKGHKKGQILDKYYDNKRALISIKIYIMKFK